MFANFNKKRKNLKPLRRSPKFAVAIPSAAIIVLDSEKEDDEEDDDIVSGTEDFDSDSDWSCSSIDSEMCDCEILIEAAARQLKESDIEVHLAVELIIRSASTVKTMINRFSKLLVWFYIKFEVKGSEIDVLQLLMDLVLKRFPMLTKYYKHLRESLQFKPSTVYNFNEDVSVLLNWFVVFRVPGEDEYSVTSNDLYGANLIIKAMRKFYSKERRVLACKSGDNTIEALVSIQKWPEGGLKELHNAVLSQMSWARKVCAEQLYRHDPTVYNNFVQLTCASFYSGIHILFI